MITKPIFFERNRVGRVYSGGMLFHDFFGDKKEDGFLPEEWIASSVTALNKDSAVYKEGVSRIRDTDIYFDDLLNENKEALLGDKKLRILVKALDSAIRLPAQAHPDKEFSKRYFNSLLNFVISSASFNKLTIANLAKQSLRFIIARMTCSG